MRSLDDFYKYVEEQEQTLREKNEATPSAGSPPDVTAPPAPGTPPPAPSAAAQDAPEPRERRDSAAPEAPAEARPSAEGFVPPPLPPRSALPSRYERIVPAEVLRAKGTGENASLEAGASPGSNGHAPAPSPANIRYMMRGGVTIPVPLEEDRAMPDIEAYIPSLRGPAPKEPSPATPQKPRDNDGGRANGAPAAEAPEYLPPIVGEKEPPLVADAPSRPRRIRRTAPASDLSDGEAAALWGRLPRHIQLLVGMAEPQEEVAQKYYARGFKESRRQLIERLLDPTLTLEDTARVLGVCPTTVRRYTNRGLLPHHRTVGQQRRFRLSDVLGFLEQQTARGPAPGRGGAEAAERDADA